MQPEKEEEPRMDITLRQKRSTSISVSLKESSDDQMDLTSLRLKLGPTGST